MLFWTGKSLLLDEWWRLRCDRKRSRPLRLWPVRLTFPLFFFCAFCLTTVLGCGCECGVWSGCFEGWDDLGEFYAAFGVTFFFPFERGGRTMWLSTALRLQWCFAAVGLRTNCTIEINVFFMLAFFFFPRVIFTLSNCVNYFCDQELNKVWCMQAFLSLPPFCACGIIFLLSCVKNLESFFVFLFYLFSPSPFPRFLFRFRKIVSASRSVCVSLGQRVMQES